MPNIFRIFNMKGFHGKKEKCKKDILTRGFFSRYIRYINTSLIYYIRYIYFRIFSTGIYDGVVVLLYIIVFQSQIYNYKFELKNTRTSIKISLLPVNGIQNSAQTV